MLHAPGHAPDHCAVYEPSAGLLWAGDMLSDLEVPMPMWRFSAYRATLRHLSELDVRILVPGHGTPTGDPDVISGRFSQDQAYLAAVQTCVSREVDRAASLAEVMGMCGGVPFAQPDDYPHARKWNIEQAYLEAGGEAAGVVGWEKDWTT